MYDRYEQKSSHLSRNVSRSERQFSAQPIQLEVDICAVTLENTLAGRRLTADITVDSGAGKSVMSPEAAPEYQFCAPSRQSEGQHFVGAGEERMPNL